MISLFQKRVYKEVRKIPKGRTLSYKEVAKRAGFPKAWRAVGNALNRNKGLEVPCHRVIRSDEKIGGYRYGKKRKKGLLKQEGVLIKKGKIVL